MSTTGRVPWKCQCCGFINDRHRDQCEACLGPRTDLPAAVPTVETSPYIEFDRPKESGSECPECRLAIVPRATKCPHCHSLVSYEICPSCRWMHPYSYERRTRREIIGDVMFSDIGTDENTPTSPVPADCPNCGVAYYSFWERLFGRSR